MNLRQIFFATLTVFILGAGTFSAAAQSSNLVTGAPIYVPDTKHMNDPLPDGVIAWDAVMKAVDATNGQDFARFTFSFTNIATKMDIVRANNVINSTNFTTITNFTPVPITILNVHPSCGCTTAELPPVPWTLPPGAGGEIKLSVNLLGKAGTLFKTVNIATDQGSRNLMLRINILPPPPVPEMTSAQRDAGIAAAKADRQAVFKNDCASCHLNKIEGKYGQQLYDAVCAICHEAAHRATMVPDLHNLNVPTNEEFWRAWITSGKAGSLMPAFATSQGGPLNDLQIASLAAYLNAVMPSRVPPPAAK